MRTAGVAPAIALFIILAAAGTPARSASSIEDACGWRPPATALSETVGTTADLFRAVAGAAPDTTILLADGEYRLERTLEIGRPGLVLRGQTGNRSKVVIRGAGMADTRVGVAIGVSAPRVTIADLTVGYVGYHGIQIRGELGASHTAVHNVQVIDTSAAPCGSCRTTRREARRSRWLFHPPVGLPRTSPATTPRTCAG